MHAIGWHRLPDKHIPHWMCKSLGWCCMPGKGDSGIPHPKMTWQCEQNMTDAGSLLPTSTKRCAQVLMKTDGLRAMSPYRCRFLFTYVMHVVTWYQCWPANVSTSRHMLANLGLYCLSLADIACPIHMICLIYDLIWAFDSIAWSFTWRSRHSFF